MFICYFKILGTGGGVGLSGLVRTCSFNKLKLYVCQISFYILKNCFINIHCYRTLCLLSLWSHRKTGLSITMSMTHCWRIRSGKNWTRRKGRQLGRNLKMKGKVLYRWGRTLWVCIVQTWIPQCCWSIYTIKFKMLINHSPVLNVCDGWTISFKANMPNMGFNSMLQQMQQQQQMGMPYMYNQGYNLQSFSQQHLLQLVQDMKQRVRE